MLKRILPALMAALMGVTLALVPSNAAHANTSSSQAKVYSQPGDHLVNGRYWKTACEKYSSSVVRCETKIWTTKIVKSGGANVSHKGWVFNNLTYLPSSRAAWAKNPLGHKGTWTASDGRKWKTECDTAATGLGGCRSYALTGKKWVVNNIVQFSSSAVAAVTTIPAAAPKLANVPVEQSVAKAAAAATGSSKQKIVSAALAKVGSRYVHNASGPSSFDCSGLTAYAYKQAGITLPHSSRTQSSMGTRVSRSNLQPGDLVFYYSPISHVGIYIGNGKIVDAANPRSGVRVASVDSMPFSGGARVG
ncbi:C40 family peptidase [Tessaracoccus antarcticus]|nr:C40 family peptidase [Tessaracoccus antarcticus]